MFKYIERLFFTVIKSRLNEKEFRGPKEITIFLLVLVIASIIACIVFFSMVWFLENTLMKNYPNISLAILMGVFIFFAYQVIKKEPEKDYNEAAFMQLLDFNDLLQEAGVSKEIARMMRVSANLSLAKISDLQREIGGPTPSLPDEFFFSMRKTVKNIANKVFVNNPF
ncbi:hypothetical protein KAK05_02625 [Candidatus Parcubacteria bacterium]|nr:hypothetical protein [Candidatus Parcubacteria bacterium]